MSTHWRQHTLIWFSVVALSLFGVLIFFFCGTQSDSSPARLYEVDEHFLNDTIIINKSDERDIENGDKFDNIQYMDDDNLSGFVTPQKIHNISLNAEDMLYESKRQSSSGGNSSLRGKWLANNSWTNEDGNVSLQTRLLRSAWRARSAASPARFGIRIRNTCCTYLVRCYISCCIRTPHSYHRTHFEWYAYSTIAPRNPIMTRRRRADTFWAAIIKATLTAIINLQLPSLSAVAW